MRPSYSSHSVLISKSRLPRSIIGDLNNGPIISHYRPSNNGYSLGNNDSIIIMIIDNNARDSVIICNNDVITYVIMSNNHVITEVIMSNYEAIITVITGNNIVITG